MRDPDCNGNNINLLERIEVAPTLIYQKSNEKTWNQILDAIKKNNIIEFDYTSKGNTTTYMFSSTQFDMIFNYLISFADEVLPLKAVELVEKWKSYWQDKIPKIIKKIEIV